MFALDTATELEGDMRKSAPVDMLMLEPVIELDDMTKSAPVEMLRVLDPVIELDDIMTK